MTTRGETPDSAKNLINFVELGMRVTINQIHIETGSKTEIIESIYTDQLLERTQIDN